MIIQYLQLKLGKKQLIKMNKIIIKYFTSILIAACIILPLNTYAADKWTKQDIVLEVTWELLQFIDYGQTLTAASNPLRYSESNPILGRHPSRDSVHLYMLSAAILHPIITHYLPRKVKVLGFDFPLRTVFQSVSIGVSGACVVNNFNVGINIGF